MTRGEDRVGLDVPGQAVVGDRYVILAEIGRGGMGVVWLAEDRVIGRRVAIKELRLPDGIPPEERGVLQERVLREARTAGRLNDPSVVTVFDVVQQAGTTYIVMELIDAPTLSGLLRERGPLPPAQVAAVAEQLLSALGTAHAAGIVHRDVKPSNILVLPNGRVKLTDFGIAQSVDDPKLTTSGVLVGSPTYMAPERIRGEEATASSDLWALGAVLYFAVEGHAAFERSTTAATMHAIMSEVPFLTRCGGPLASVIMGLLISTPEARLPTHQVRELLGKATSTEATPVSGMAAHHAAAAVTLPVQGSRPAMAARPRRRVLMGVLAVVLLAAGLAGGWFARPWLADDRPANMDPAMAYGKGGDIPEFSYSGNNNTCLMGKLEPGRQYPDSASGDCTELHDIEAFDNRETFKTKTEFDERPVFDYPGLAMLTRYAEAYCAMSFDSEWVTLAPDDARGERKRAELRFRVLVPSAEFWTKSLDAASLDSSDDSKRVFYCVAYRADGGQMSTQLRTGRA